MTGRVQLRNALCRSPVVVVVAGGTRPPSSLRLLPEQNEAGSVPLRHTTFTSSSASISAINFTTASATAEPSEFRVLGSFR